MDVHKSAKLSQGGSCSKRVCEQEWPVHAHATSDARSLALSIHPGGSAAATAHLGRTRRVSSATRTPTSATLRTP